MILESMFIGQLALGAKNSLLTELGIYKKFDLGMSRKEMMLRVDIIDFVGDSFASRVAQHVADLVESQVLATELALEKPPEQFSARWILEQLVYGKPPAANTSLWNVFPLGHKRL